MVNEAVYFLRTITESRENFSIFIESPRLTFQLIIPKIRKLICKVKKLLLLFSLWPFFLSGQIVINFENGLPGSTQQFPADRWNITSEDPLVGSYSLKHSFDNTVSSCDRISFTHDEILLSHSVTWEFTLRYPYNPSSSNNWAVFLMSEKPAEFMNPGSENHALVFGVNYTSNDDFLKLWLQNDKGT